MKTRSFVSGMAILLSLIGVIGCGEKNPSQGARKNITEIQVPGDGEGPRKAQGKADICGVDGKPACPPVGSCQDGKPSCGQASEVCSDGKPSCGVEGQKPVCPAGKPGCPAEKSEVGACVAGKPGCDPEPAAPEEVCPMQKPVCGEETRRHCKADKPSCENS